MSELSKVEHDTSATGIEVGYCIAPGMPGHQSLGIYAIRPGIKSLIYNEKVSPDTAIFVMGLLKQIMKGMNLKYTD